MFAGIDTVIPTLAMFIVSLAMTVVSLWIGGRMAPWFLKERFDPPTVRSYFMQPDAEMEITRGRMVSVLGAAAVLLAMLLVMAVAVRFGGVALV